MLTFQIAHSLQRLVDYFGKLSDGLDLMPLAMQFKMIAIEDNMIKSAAGEDKEGVEIESYAPLRGGRMILPSEIRARGGTGPPLAPKGAGSRVNTAFEVEIARLGYYGDDKAISIKGAWPSLYWMKYHIEGRGRNPRRDVAGIRPVGMDKMADATRQFAIERLGLY